MQEKHLYEYAIVRLLPKVERGECINVGVALFCKSLKIIEFKYLLNSQRILAIYPDIDLSEVQNHLDAFAKICAGKKEGGFIASQDMASRFRWLTARRSTIIQCSEVHPGYCDKPEIALQKIFETMVL